MFKWVKKAQKIFSGSVSDSSLVHVEDDGFMSEDIAVSIEDIISDEDQDDIGKLHVLSLTEFHEALGETWDAREEKIFRLTEGVLRDQVGLGNRWEHQSKEVYIMLFPTLSEIEADARAYDIAEEVGMKIIGARFDGSRRPLARIAGVDPQEALNEDGTLDIAKLEEIGREGQSAGSATEGNNPKLTDIKNQKKKQSESDSSSIDPDSLDWKKKAFDHEEHDHDWKKNQHDHDEQDHNWKKNQHEYEEHDQDWRKNQHEHTETDTNWKKIEKEKEEKKKEEPQWVTVSAKEDHSKPTTGPVKPKYNVVYSPCWERESQSLRFYKALLHVTSPKGNIFEGARAYRGHKTDEQRLKIDLWVLQNAAKTLFPFADKAVEIPMFIPVHSSSLRAENGEKLIKFISSFSETLRQKYLVIEILDDGKWVSEDLTSLLKKLKQHVSHIAFAPSSQSDFSLPESNDINWLGLTLSDLDAESGITTERLQALQSEAAVRNIKTYMFGLKRRAQISDMLELGADLVGGVALVKSTQKLRAPFALPIERLQQK